MCVHGQISGLYCTVCRWRVYLHLSNLRSRNCRRHLEEMHTKHTHFVALSSFQEATINIFTVTLTCIPQLTACQVATTLSYTVAGLIDEEMCGGNHKTQQGMDSMGKLCIQHINYTKLQTPQLSFEVRIIKISVLVDLVTPVVIIVSVV